ncbi:MAG: putative porin, partial [Bacteroidaceae bacterium]|nr:putative porin [Bacteroidaceae bacterium]
NYKVGFTRHREEYVVRDSTRTDTIHKEEFIPVSKFIHTLSIQSNKHSFYSSLDSSKNVSNWRYANTYLTNDFTSADSTTYTSIRNLFGVSLLEGFNKYAKAGLTAFLEHEFREVSLMPHDSLVAGAGMETFRENEIYAGGILAKKEGNLLHYSALGKVGILGEALGQFDLHGSLDLNFPLGGDTVQFVARGKIQNKLPAFYYRHYRSNHFRWDNDLDKEFRSRVEGELSWARTHTRLRGGIENIKNYTYLNSEALPTQEAKNFQVFDFQINQDFRMGILHWDNEAIYQHSTNKALPLPDLSLYSNLYLDTYLAKRVMHVQMGVDVRYFSEYDAPTYTAALGQYNLQSTEDKVSIGGYPLVSAYVNVRVKKTRFFVQMYHLNQSNGNYFTVPHYPLNPSLLKMGLSVYFYD